MQPLLQFGGRGYILEPLTIVERQLLANLRAFQRYRQGFYTNVVIGDATNVSGPQRDGGFAGGTGLTGFSGTGTGGFGQLGQVVNFGGRNADRRGCRRRRRRRRRPALPSATRARSAVSSACSSNCNRSATPKPASTLNCEASACWKPIRRPERSRSPRSTCFARTLKASGRICCRPGQPGQHARRFQSRHAGLASQHAGRIGRQHDRAISPGRSQDDRTCWNKIDDFIDLLGELPHKPIGISSGKIGPGHRPIARPRGRNGSRSAHADLDRLDKALPERFKLLDERGRKRLQEDRDKLSRRSE